MKLIYIKIYRDLKVVMIFAHKNPITVVTLVFTEDHGICKTLKTFV